jgi:preprotein translocase subunit SecE
LWSWSQERWNRGAARRWREELAVMAAGKQTKVESVQSWPTRVRNYIEEHRREMRLVTWPSREQVQSTTIVVLVTVAFFGVYFGIVDYILALGQTRLYQMFTR